ncbi:MAG: DUF3177 family protein [Synechococcus sp.]|nr:DUF3177 family protein [Synechococcus sp.]
MPDLPYRSLVWLTYRLGATFAFGLPLVLLIWASLRKEVAISRLMGIYWKVASLLVITLLLLTDQRPLGYVTALLAPVLMTISVWFWVDLNEELSDRSLRIPLVLTVRLWRWALSGFSLIATGMAISSLSCVSAVSGAECRAWLEAPQGLHLVLAKVFDFLFGGEWTAAVAAFLGYVMLVAYAVGLLQWVLMRLPRQGRVAGDF